MLDRVLFWAFNTLFCLVPLLISPFNFELFEFPKMLLVYVLTSVIVAVWVIKMILRKKIIFQRTFWDWPLGIFFISQLISFIFSIDRHTSFWGFYSRFNGGLFSIICYLLLYWAYVSNMTKRETKYVIRNTLIGATLVALYGIAEHFGIDDQYWVQDVKNRVFSTLGQPNWLAAYLVALLPLAFELRASSFELRKKILYALVSIIYALCLFFTKSRSGFLGLGISLLVFFGLTFFQKLKKFWPIIFVILLPVFIFLIKVPWQSKSVDANITESSEIRKIVWKGAIKTWQNQPLFGTGPETFAYSYYWSRPREHNDVSEWDFLYNKAHNEYLNYLATTGIFGLGSYLLLIGVFIFWNIKSIRYQVLSIKLAFLAGWVSILATNFFGFSVVPVQLFFFLFPALSFSLSQKSIPQKLNQKLNLTQKLAISFILIFTIYYLLFILKYWLADEKFSQAEKLNDSQDYQAAFLLLNQAIKLRPNEPVYYDEQAISAANLQLSQATVEASDKALKISPYNLNFWKNRAKNLYKLGIINQKYYQESLEALLTAAQLAPTDAKVHYNLGLLYGQLGQNQAAIETLEKTVELKPNYGEAHYALALFYKETKEIEKARQHLKYILEKISSESELAKEELEKL